MLHRTHHPIYLPSTSSKFISFSLSTTTTTTTATNSQVVKEMECMMKQVISENSNYSQNAGEDFFVDQLLNLKDEETMDEDKEDDKEEPLEEIEAPPSTIKVETDDFTSVLSIPEEEEDLEWLSHFVEESFSQFSTPYPVAHGPINPKPEPDSNPKTSPCILQKHALSKPRRTKRARTGGRVWSTAIADSSSSSSQSGPNSDPTRRKKQRKREGGPPRRCSHCGVQKTPQWRAGPLGPKTLCNACGVRYKSGRLLPEYRPACSPTFSTELHSNNHRKVLEMRKKKVVVVVSGQLEPRLSHPVPSFG